MNPTSTAYYTEPIKPCKNLKAKQQTRENHNCDVMAEEQIKYKLISAKLVGSNVVNFRLEDGTLVKIHVELTRIGVATDRKAPDGTPLYNFSINNRVDIETKDKTFYAPAPPIPTQSINDKKPNQYTS